MKWSLCIFSCIIFQFSYGFVFLNWIDIFQGQGVFKTMLDISVYFTHLHISVDCAYAC